jgi:hypothetical protein
MTQTIINRILAVLKSPTKVLDFLIYAKVILKAMTGNSNFTSSAARVTQLGTDITALDAAELALNAEPPTGTVAARNAAWEVVKNDLRILRNDVQTAADLKPAQSEAIIKSAGMQVKKSGSRDKRKDEVKDGIEEGSVFITGKGSGAHQWQQSTDGGETQTELNPTTKGNTTVTGLESGKKYWFRNRQIKPKGEYGPWSPWLSIRVN